MRGVDLVVMSGQHGESSVEQMVDRARGGITRDLLDAALGTGAFHRIVLSTNDSELAEAWTGVGAVTVELDPPDEEFHFGRRLQWLIARHGIERLVYLGGGCAPLLSARTLEDMADQLRAADRLLLCNNFYSVDFCGFTPAATLLTMDPPSNDNSLGWLLGDSAGLPARELPRTAATLFDVDTPVDLVVLSLHPDVPPHTRACLDGLQLDTRSIEAASAVFVDRHGEVVVGGRVSSSTLAYLERETACRSRVYSEERGMRADGRLARGEVRSLLGMLVTSVGVERFFGEVIPQLGQAAFLDDRVLWAHHKLWPPPGDRFNSDLYRVDAIGDPFVRRFTEAAARCPIPVVLG